MLQFLIMKDAFSLCVQSALGRREVRTEAGRSLKRKLQEFKQEMTVAWTYGDTFELYLGSRILKTRLMG